MIKTFQDETLFGFSNFGHWKLFDICNLTFVISELPIKQIPSGDNQRLVLSAPGFLLYAFGGKPQAHIHKALFHPRRMRTNRI